MYSYLYTCDYTATHCNIDNKWDILQTHYMSTNGSIITGYYANLTRSVKLTPWPGGHEVLFAVTRDCLSSHPTKDGRATDSCFALIVAHRCGVLMHMIICISTPHRCAPIRAKQLSVALPSFDFLRSMPDDRLLLDLNPPQVKHLCFQLKQVEANRQGVTERPVDVDTVYIYATFCNAICVALYASVRKSFYIAFCRTHVITV